MAESFSYKLTPESQLFSFDFSQVVQASETILAATCTAIVKDGTDPDPTAILVGSPSISGSKASQRIAGGISEVTYRIEMTITTSQGNIYVGVGDLAVYDPSLV